MDDTKIVLLNENSDPEIVGDLSVHKNIDALRLHLEPWFANETHLALRLDGVQVRLEALGNEIRVVDERPYPRGAEIVRTWLRQLSNLETQKLPNAVREAIERK